MTREGSLSSRSPAAGPRASASSFAEASRNSLPVSSYDRARACAYTRTETKPRQSSYECSVNIGETKRKGERARERERERDEERENRKKGTSRYRGTTRVGPLATLVRQPYTYGLCGRVARTGRVQRDRIKQKPGRFLLTRSEDRSRPLVSVRAFVSFFGGEKRKNIRLFSNKLLS